MNISWIDIKLFIRAISLCLGLSFATGVGALSVPGLFEAEVAMPAQATGTPQEQQQLIHQAFKDVLVRTSGSEKVLGSDAVLQALSRVDKYVVQFSYHQSPTSERILRVRFNENLIKELLSAAKQPLWENNRSVTLMWLTIEQDKKPKWLAETALESLKAISVTANKRGLPLMWPLLDLTDTALVSEQIIWEGNKDIVLQASKRYNADAILIGKINPTSEGFQGQWRLLLEGGREETWDSKAPDLNALLQTLLENTSLKLMSRDKNTKLSSAQNYQLTLAVSGIVNMEQYARVLKYLKALPAVSQVEVTQINPENTLFKIQTTETEAVFAQSIAKEKILVEKPSMPATGTTGTLLYKVAEVL